MYQLLSVTNAQNDKISYSYDNVGNVVTVVDPRKSKSTDPDDYTSKSTYDKAHRPKTATDALGKSTSTEYDRDGNVISTTDADGNKTLVTLDERGKAIQVKAPHTKDASGNVVYRTTQVEYDQVGNQTKVISPRGVETTDDPDDFAQVTVYDALNRPKEKVSPYDKDDARYNTPDKTVMTYDEIGNVTKVSAPASEGQTVRNDTSYSYFDNGWVKSSTDPWDIAATYGYNDLGQQTARTLTSAGGSSSRTMAWNFFPDGKLKSRSDDGVPVGLDVSLVDNSDTGDVDVAGDLGPAIEWYWLPGDELPDACCGDREHGQAHVEAERAGRRQVHRLRQVPVRDWGFHGSAIRGQHWRCSCEQAGQSDNGSRHLGEPRPIHLRRGDHRLGLPDTGHHRDGCRRRGQGGSRQHRRDRRGEEGLHLHLRHQRQPAADH